MSDNTETPATEAAEVETTTETEVELIETELSPEHSKALQLARDAAERVEKAKAAASTRGHQVDRGEVDRQIKELTAFSLLAIAEQGGAPTSMVVNNYGVPTATVELFESEGTTSATVTPVSDEGGPTGDDVTPAPEAKADPADRSSKSRK